MSGEWLAEGASRRSDSRIAPVKHLLVSDGTGGWLMWCSAGPGTVGNYQGSRRCGRCRTLAREAVADETLSAAAVPGWVG